MIMLHRMLEKSSRELLPQPCPKPGPPLMWQQVTVLGILFFVVRNEIECPHQQVRLVKLLLADKPRREDCLHLIVVRDRDVHVLQMFWVSLQFIRSNSQ